MYSIDDYERPSVAADSIVFGIDITAPESRKSLKQRKLMVLLIKRGEEPFLGHFSMPGGFLRKGESIEQAAVRELNEEAGVNEPKIIGLGVYSKAGRDPRGWIISCAFIALTKTVELKTAVGSDAAEARWFEFEYEDRGSEEVITLTGGDDRIEISYSEGQAHENALAFDHGQMLYDAFKKLRDEVVHHDLIFDLMPQLFAISDLQQPYEAIVGTKLTPQGFRKKMMSKLTETEFYDEAAAHRTSKLYSRKTN